MIKNPMVSYGFQNMQVYPTHKTLTKKSIGRQGILCPVMSFVPVFLDCICALNVFNTVFLFVSTMFVPKDTNEIRHYHPFVWIVENPIDLHAFSREAAGCLHVA